MKKKEESPIKRKLTKDEKKVIKYKIKCLERIPPRDRTARDKKMIDSFRDALKKDKVFYLVKYKKIKTKSGKIIKVRKIGKNKRKKLKGFSKDDWKESYSNYIHSRAWNKKREEVYNERGKSCEKCGTYSNVNVYHKDFKTAFFERLDDLIILCTWCREKHDKNPNYNFYKQS